MNLFWKAWVFLIVKDYSNDWLSHEKKKKVNAFKQINKIDDVLTLIGNRII